MHVSSMGNVYLWQENNQICVHIKDASKLQGELSVQLVTYSGFRVPCSNPH